MDPTQRAIEHVRRQWEAPSAKVIYLDEYRAKRQRNAWLRTHTRPMPKGAA